MQDDEARFAPPDIHPEDALSDASEAAEAAPIEDEPIDDVEIFERAEAVEAEEDVFVIVSEDERETLDFSPDLDIDAALAAVSTLDDVLAAQEAAEQERLAREASDLAAREQREARRQHPELFFPMPPPSTLQRGRIDSVVPALALIAIGAWLTFVLTTTQSPPDPLLVVLAVVGAVGVSFLARWVSSGRWTRGNLFFALLLIFTTGVTAALIVTGNLITGWPLIFAGVGLAFFITNRFTGLLLIVAGVLGWAVTANLIPASIVTASAGLWPVAVGLILVFLLMPILFRRRG